MGVLPEQERAGKLALCRQLLAAPAPPCTPYVQTGVHRARHTQVPDASPVLIEAAHSSATAAGAARECLTASALVSADGAASPSLRDPSSRTVPGSVWSTIPTVGEPCCRILRGDVLQGGTQLSVEVVDRPWILAAQNGFHLPPAWFNG